MFYQLNLEAPIGTTVHAETGASAPRVTTRHNGIAGRARLQVLGLRGNDRLREALEALDPEKGIERVSASAVTGNVLVFYDPERDLEEIVGYLEVVVHQPPPRSAKPAAPRPPAGGGILGFLRSLLTRAERPHPPELTPARPRRPGPAEGRAPETLPEPWHTAGAGQAAAFWRISIQRGLTSAEAAARLERYGSNLLPPPRGRSALSILGEQFLSLPVLLLAGSAALSVVTGGIADAVVIGAVVALNAGIGFATEFHADRTILSLLEISEPEARVLRDGRVEGISGDEVVPGDLLVLSHGRAVVADARLVACTRLTVDEAALTGESLPLEKRSGALGEQRLPLAERRNMVYRGTVVTGGQGLAIVVATGRHTEIGKVQALLAESIQPETPLQRQMHRLGTQLTWMICGVSAGMFALGMLRGYSAVEMLRSAISLAIAAVPEGLPTVATVCLANGMRSLMRENVLARRMAAVEALGAVETLCFDKTGTLTWNRMSAVAVHTGMRHYTVSGAAFHAGHRTVTPASHGEFSKLLEVCALCSEAGIQWRDGEWTIEGSPTESALVRLALQGGLEVDGLRHRYPLAGTRHRTESEAYMITTHRLPNGRELIAVKGSPAQVLQLCDWYARDDQVHRLAAPERGEILEANAQMARGGLRVLGAACVERETGAAGGERFVWLGLIGLADPPRQGLKEVIAQFHRAGVRPLMLTGDQAATAEAVAEELGLNGNRQPVAARATDFDGLDAHAAASLMRRATVFSRVTPSNKLQIVRALQSEGEIVAMTGDGVNDAPALKAADVGIAMGQGGTKVARGVADLLLMDDNIASLLPAIREGRRVYEDLRKSVHYVAATNTSEMLLMFACVAAGLGQPLNPRQLLWINLLTDVLPELALAVEPPEAEIMTRPPRDPSEPVIGRPEYLRLGRQSGIMTASAMAAYIFGLTRGGGATHASTLAFLTLTSAQLLHGITARSERRVVELPPNPAMRNGLLAGFVLLAASQIFPGLTSLLGTSRIGILDVLVCAGAAVASFLGNEALKQGPAGQAANLPDSNQEDVEDAHIQWIQ